MSGASGPIVTLQTPLSPRVSGCGLPSSSPAATTLFALGREKRSVIVRSALTSGEVIRRSRLARRRRTPSPMRHSKRARRNREQPANPSHHVLFTQCAWGPPPPRAYQSMRATARPRRSWSSSRLRDQRRRAPPARVAKRIRARRQPQALPILRQLLNQLSLRHGQARRCRFARLLANNAAYHLSLSASVPRTVSPRESAAIA